MRIAIGGMQKNEMEQEILKCCPDAQTIITNDMKAAYDGYERLCAAS